MTQQSSGEILQFPNQIEALDKIESLKTNVLSEIDRQFLFCSDEPARCELNSYGVQFDEAGQEVVVLYKRSKKLPVDPEVLDEDHYGEGITAVNAKAVITYKVNVIEPEHWKRALLRKRYVPARYEPTDEICSIDVYLDAEQPGRGWLGAESWWLDFEWRPNESIKKQRKHLKRIQSVLELIEANTLTP